MPARSADGLGKTPDLMAAIAGTAALTLLSGLIASAPAHADELVQQGLKASRVPQWSSVPVRQSVVPVCRPGLSEA